VVGGYLAGGRSGALPGGCHIRVTEEMPISNLQFTMLQNFGVQRDLLGDSTGIISGLFNS
jgi:hypothetical protein